MKILVTGAAGFIGSHVTERLLSAGHEVVGLDDFNDYYDPRLKMLNISSARKMRGFIMVEGDIRDEQLVNRLFAHNDFEVVIHLAARAGVRPSIQQPALYETANVVGLLTLLEAAVKFSKPYFVFASSSSVYGVSPRLPWREDDPVDCPISPYAVTKRTGEMLCYSYHKTYGLKTCSLRFFTVFGPRQRPEMAIAKFFRAMIEDQPITIYGDGTATRDFTYVADIVDGVVASLEKNFENEIINLGGGNTISVSDLISGIGEVLNKEPKLDFLPAQAGDVPATWADTTKALALLGQAPKTSLHDGLLAYHAWLQEIAKAV